jgi:hypothetical protein
MYLPVNPRLLSSKAVVTLNSARQEFAETTVRDAGQISRFHVSLFSPGAQVDRG